MKCAMCNGFVRPEFKDIWSVNLPNGGKLSICGRCYVLTAILDKLTEIAQPKEKTDG